MRKERQQRALNNEHLKAHLTSHVLAASGLLFKLAAIR